MDQPESTRDTFDRIVGAIDGTCPKSKPSTVVDVQPIVGNSQTYIVQTYKTDFGMVSFVQMVDAQGRARIVLPPKVTAALYRQRESLIKTARRNRAKDRWADLTDDQRAAAVERLRGARANADKAGAKITVTEA